MSWLRKSIRIYFCAKIAFILIAACSCTFWPIQASDAKDHIGCAIFPADNVWNTKVDKLPVDSQSDVYVRSIGLDKRLHPDFGAGLWKGAAIGMPYVIVDDKQPRIPVRFDYADESDAANYPIPPTAPVEGNGEGDRHVLVIEKDSCTLYELFAASRQPDGSWQAGSGAIYDLRSNALRPPGWTSADAAGLPIFPGLARYGEVASGEIRHAFRFTAPRTRNEYIWPARHQASHLTDRQYPPMGQRFRLKASVDIRHFSRDGQVVVRALKTYGMFLADNGGPWFLSGAPDGRWSDQLTDDLKSLRGSDFEAVDEFSLRKDNDSGRVR